MDACRERMRLAEQPARRRRVECPMAMEAPRAIAERERFREERSGFDPVAPPILPGAHQERADVGDRGIELADDGVVHGRLFTIRRRLC